MALLSAVSVVSVHPFSAFFSTLRADLRGVGLRRFVNVSPTDTNLDETQVWPPLSLRHCCFLCPRCVVSLNMSAAIPAGPTFFISIASSLEAVQRLRGSASP